MFLLALWSCTPGSETGPCDPPGITHSPADGATNVGPASPITVQFDTAPAEDPYIWVDGGVGGDAVPDPARTTWTMTPDSPLARSTTYTTRVEVCGEATEARFTTLGPAVGDSVVGGMWRMELDADDTLWIAPAGSDFIRSVMGNSDSFIFTASALEAGDMFTALVPGREHDGVFEQDPCASPVLFDAVSFDADPHLSVPPTLVTLPIGSVTYQVFDFTAEWTFSPDGAGLEALRIAGLLDVRPLGFGSVCPIAEAAGGGCVPCPDQAAGTPEAACLGVEILDPWAPRVDVALGPGGGC